MINDDFTEKKEESDPRLGGIWGYLVQFLPAPPEHHGDSEKECLIEFGWVDSREGPDRWGHGVLCGCVCGRMSASDIDNAHSVEEKIQINEYVSFFTFSFFRGRVKCGYFVCVRIWLSIWNHIGESCGGAARGLSHSEQNTALCYETMWIWS